MSMIVVVGFKRGACSCLSVSSIFLRFTRSNLSRRFSVVCVPFTQPENPFPIPFFTALFWFSTLSLSLRHGLSWRFLVVVSLFSLTSLATRTLALQSQLPNWSIVCWLVYSLSVVWIGCWSLEWRGRVDFVSACLTYRIFCV